MIINTAIFFRHGTFACLSRTNNNQTFANEDSELVTSTRRLDPAEYEELIKSDSICQPPQNETSFDAHTSYGILCGDDPEDTIGKCNNRYLNIILIIRNYLAFIITHLVALPNFPHPYFLIEARL